MYLLHLILLLFLSLLAPIAAAVPGQVVDVTIGNVGQDLGLDADNPLVARQGFPSDLLLTYEVKCALEPAKTEPAPGKKKSFLSNDFCKRWWVCKSDGNSPRNVIDAH